MLTVENLDCIRQEKRIFSDLSFQLQAGEVLWVKGRNGAGKSSLLRIVAQFLKPAAGRLLWQGTEISEDPDAYLKSFEYIGHQDALKSALSPRENLQFWMQYRGSNGLTAALAALELNEIADYPARNLSAGQKKRSNLARLIACPSPLWILDEPISSLDAHHIDLFRNLLKTHIENGGLALLATHQDIKLGNERVLDLDNIERRPS